MMDGAYFVGRKELLDFFNNLLDLEYTKIEQTASGAMACQITSLIFPQSVAMSRVNWDAKADFEFVQNYKVLQNAFNKHNVQRFVDVDKLIRAKYQDNLEFCQWLKAFFDQSGAQRPDTYDPAAVRLRGKGGARFNAQFGRKPLKGGRPVQPKQQSSATTTGARRPTTTTVRSTTVKTTTNNTTTLAGRASRPLRDRDVHENTTTTVPAGPSQAEYDALQTENAELKSRVTEMEQSLLALEEERDLAILEIEKERDFYFTKLRDVEVLLQIHQERNSGMPTAVLDELFKVLYAAAEEDVEVTDEGLVVTRDAAAVAADANDSLDEELQGV